MMTITLSGSMPAMHNQFGAEILLYPHARVYLDWLVVPSVVRDRAGFSVRLLPPGGFIDGELEVLEHDVSAVSIEAAVLEGMRLVDCWAVEYASGMGEPYVPLGGRCA